MKVTFRQKGNFKNTERFLNRMENLQYNPILDRFGREGVAALSAATPSDSGLTAQSWSYTIENTDAGCSISWTNSNVQDGWYNVAIGIQFGHATGTGGWVEGIDYINPALRPIFDQMAEELWREVQKP